MDWQQEEQDVEFETFLRQFQPRTPPVLKAGRRLTPRTLAITAVVLMACVIPVRLLRDKPAEQNSPKSGEVGLRPKPADSANKVVSPSISGAASPASVASRPQPPADGSNKIAPRSTSGAATRAVVAGSPRPGVAVQNGPLRVGGIIKPPIRIFNVNAIYPEEAQAAGIQGVVILQIMIGEDGSVTNARVLRSIPMLDQAAIDAVLQWIYEPTLLNGVPVEVEMDVGINFTLRCVSPSHGLLAGRGTSRFFQTNDSVTTNPVTVADDLVESRSGAQRAIIAR